MSARKRPLAEYDSWVHMFNINVDLLHYVLPWPPIPDLGTTPDFTAIMAFWNITKFHGWPHAWRDYPTEGVLACMDNCTHWVVLPTITRMSFDAFIARCRIKAKHRAVEKLRKTDVIYTEQKQIDRAIEAAKHHELRALLEEFRINKPVGGLFA